MRTASPQLHDVVGSLPALLIRSLDVDAAGDEVDALVAAGWRTGQLQARVGGQPSLGSPDRDAEQVLLVLRSLRGQAPPDVVHARELAQRSADRERAQAEAPTPASPEVRRRSLARIRNELGLQPGRRAEALPRTRPPCSLCDGEGSFFVSRDVHLCPRCVAVLATGEARLVPGRSTG